MTVFKRYRTPSGAHATLSEAWAAVSGYTELKESPLGVDGKPKPPYQPARKTTGDRPVTATEAAEPEANKEATEPEANKEATK